MGKQLQDVIILPFSVKLAVMLHVMIVADKL